MAIKSYLIIVPLVLAASAGPCLAAEGSEQPEQRMLKDAELEELRGGFLIGGLDVHFAADIQTHLNGELVLQTTINWGDSGLERTQTVSPTITQATADMLASSVLGGSVALTNQQGQAVFLANDGQTAFFHRTDGALQNFLINGYQGANVAQQVNATIDIGNYGKFSQQLATDSLTSSLNDAMNAATAGALGY